MESIGPALHLILSASLAFLAMPVVSAVTATASGMRWSGMPGMWVTAITPGIFLASVSSIDTTDAPWVAGIASTVGRNSFDEKRSVLYCQVPVAISRALYLVWGLPTILYSLGFFGSAALATGS